MCETNDNDNLFEDNINMDKNEKNIDKNKYVSSTDSKMEVNLPPFPSTDSNLNKNSSFPSGTEARQAGFFFLNNSQTPQTSPSLSPSQPPVRQVSQDENKSIYPASTQGNLPQGTINPASTQGNLSHGTINPASIQGNLSQGTINPASIQGNLPQRAGNPTTMQENLSRPIGYQVGMRNNAAREYYRQDMHEKTPPQPIVAAKKEGRRGIRNIFIAILLIFALLFSGYSGAWFMKLSIESETESQNMDATTQDATQNNTAQNEETTEEASQATNGIASGAASFNSANTIAEVAQKAGPSVVEITTEYTQFHPFYGQYVSTGAGSGVIISSDGYIVTNNHVVEGASSVVVRLNDGTEYTASVIGYESRESDLAVLKISATGLKAAQFADSDTILVGQVAVAIGNPLGELGGTVTEGIISATERLIYLDNTPMYLLQTSAAINPGNSGGGLFDSNGNLVGIVVAKSSGTEIEGLGFAIPSNMVNSVINSILSNS